MSQPSLPPDEAVPTSARGPSALFDQPSADFVLRSSDGVDFRVHSQILAQASPFFAAMLSLPQPAPQAPQDVAGESQHEYKATAEPRADVSEDSVTLDALLHLVYPVPKTTMEDPAQMLPVVKAAKKYDLALPLQILCQWLIAIVPRKPLFVWATACRAGLEDVARHAATQLSKQNSHGLSSKLNVEAMAFVDSLGPVDGISAADYFRLKQFLRCKGKPADGKSLTLLSPTPQDPQPKKNKKKKDAPDVPFESFATDIPLTDVLCVPAPGEEPTEPLHAHRAVLSVHSTVLKASLANHRELVSDDHATGAPPDTSPCTSLQFDEDVALVSALLTVCYQGRASLEKPRPLTVLAKLLVATEKYGMADVAHWVQAAWDKKATWAPLEAYFVAIAHGLEGCAKAAALTVRERPSLLTAVYIPTMEQASASVYHRLLKFIDAYRQIARTHLSPLVQPLRECMQLHDKSNATEEKAMALETFQKLETINAIGAAEGCGYATLDAALPGVLEEMLPYLVQRSVTAKIGIPNAAWQLLTIHKDILFASEAVRWLSVPVRPLWLSVADAVSG
ncbi:hypothetical protein C8Q70DRAFT_225388 [Cubamyces menziesii]|uniref:BTB domain-containing protein n=1 Tax=Trametes cubensis TaxID=1111947 RepID=A0AAD7TZP7_9APHY|nr:hypothetical protein C8Q70DRAFT_225388 [Cubamyces menziesii]KAJ8490206.1 hypothetical protein ONZ51_g2431 [Trametes cubensis]